MDYKDFIPRQVAFDGFVKMRKRILDSVDRGEFADVFADVCANALAGDSIAQDVAAYFFNKGVPGWLSENYHLYMSWQILAGANGNEFALEKMEFMLNSALQPLIYDEEILGAALESGILNKDNAIMVISNLICEAVADFLHLNPKELIKFDNKPVPYSAQVNRIFLDAIAASVPIVAKYMLS